MTPLETQKRKRESDDVDDPLRSSQRRRGNSGAVAAAGNRQEQQTGLAATLIKGWRKVWSFISPSKKRPNRAASAQAEASEPVAFSFDRNPELSPSRQFLRTEDRQRATNIQSRPVVHHTASSVVSPGTTALSQRRFPSSRKYRPPFSPAKEAKRSFRSHRGRKRPGSSDASSHTSSLSVSQTSTGTGPPRAFGRKKQSSTSLPNFDISTTYQPSASYHQFQAISRLLQEDRMDERSKDTALQTNIEKTGRTRVQDRSAGPRIPARHHKHVSNQAQGFDKHVRKNHTAEDEEADILLDDFNGVDWRTSRRHQLPATSAAQPIVIDDDEDNDGRSESKSAVAPADLPPTAADQGSQDEGPILVESSAEASEAGDAAEGTRQAQAPDEVDKIQELLERLRQIRVAQRAYVDDEAAEIFVQQRMSEIDGAAGTKDPRPEIPQQIVELQDELLQRPPGSVVRTVFNLDIMVHDLQSLQGLNWLNDNVINGMFDMIRHRSEQDERLPTVWTFSSFFYPSLKANGYTKVRRWTKKCKETVFKRDKVILPVHVNGNHWCCGCINFKAKRIEYYDSFHSGAGDFFRVMRGWLMEESKAKLNQFFDFEGWTDYDASDCPVQQNCSDCGVFTIRFGEYLSRDQTFDFSQEHMPYYRRRTAAELIDGKLFDYSA